MDGTEKKLKSIERERNLKKKAKKNKEMLKYGRKKEIKSDKSDRFENQFRNVYNIKEIHSY